MLPPGAFLRADWPAPPGVVAGTTTRLGGVSGPPYRSLNLATHVGDAAADVARNRRLLAEALQLPAAPLWLDQRHGCDVVRLEEAAPGTAADGVVAASAGGVCAVLTADCLPVVLAARDGSSVGIAHAGWRGLAGGVLEALLARMPAPPEALVAWLGPAISGRRYEVGEEVRRALLTDQPEPDGAFLPSPAGRWLADLCALARGRLARAGVRAVYGGRWCTFEDARRFYSFRRDGVCGRMATLAWIAEGS